MFLIAWFVLVTGNEISYREVDIYIKMGAIRIANPSPRPGAPAISPAFTSIGTMKVEGGKEGGGGWGGVKGLLGGAEVGYHPRSGWKARYT